MPVTFGSGPSATSKTVNSRTSIIVIDFQNEFVRPAGRLHGDVSVMMEATGMLQKIPHVVRAARYVISNN